MKLFSKDRKDAKWVKPKDSVSAIMPYIMDKRTEAEVSSKVTLDITELCKYIDKQNKTIKEYKMTYFHGILACFAMTIFNRNHLNRFIKNRRLYQRNKITFAFVAKNKLSDEGEEILVTIDLNKDDNIFTFSRKIAVDVFKIKKEGSNNFDDTLKFFTSLPKWLLLIIVKFVKFLDNHGWNPKALTEGDLNYSSILFSNLGSIKTDSCYHHLNNYGTNSIMVTIGTIKEDNNKKTVDIQCTIDERIADGFYFAKSIKLVQYIAQNPKLLEEKLSTKIDYDI